MIHFDFIVDDIDAENIFSCISDRISDMHQNILKNSTLKNISLDEKIKNKCEAEIKWYYSHINYLNKLKEKMKNTIV